MANNEKERLDKVLYLKKLVKSRSQAKDLIERGFVFSDGKQLLQPSQLIDLEKSIEIKKTIQYVGRGGDKIEGAFNYFNLDVLNLTIADIGASTGGFTDFVIKNGAKKVYAIDVGHNQLDAKLKEDDRVVQMDGVNIKEKVELGEKVDFCMIDLSFISLKLVIDSIRYLLKENDWKMLALIKPQFELSAKELNKKGLVKDLKKRKGVLRDMVDFLKDKNIYVENLMATTLKGKEGNQEYFFLCGPNKNNLIDYKLLEDLK